MTAHKHINTNRVVQPQLCVCVCERCNDSGQRQLIPRENKNNPLQERPQTKAYLPAEASACAENELSKCLGKLSFRAPWEHRSFLHTVARLLEFCSVSQGTLDGPGAGTNQGSTLGKPWGNWVFFLLFFLVPSYCVPGCPREDRRSLHSGSSWSPPVAAINCLERSKVYHECACVRVLTHGDVEVYLQSSRVTRRSSPNLFVGEPPILRTMNPSALEPDASKSTMSWIPVERVSLACLTRTDPSRHIGSYSSHHLLVAT